MYLLTIMLMCRFSWGHGTGAVIQIRQWGALGGEEALAQVLVNGINLTNRNEEIDQIIRVILPDAPTRMHTEVSEAATSGRYTLLRVRECTLDGSSLSVQLSDRVFHNGRVYLTLDQTTDTWSPRRLGMDRVRDEKLVGLTDERRRLQEGCAHLMRELKLSAASTVSGHPVAAVLTPVLLLLVFLLLVVISLLISKKHGFWHPGGVVGSIIHYPKNITEMPQERRDADYQAIEIKDDAN